jgi:hypothetical protein
MSNLMKIRLVVAKLFHEGPKDERTDRYDEANNRFSQICEGA